MKVGVVGLGLMGQVHLEAWRVAGANVAALHDLNSTHAEKLAIQYNAKATSLEELLEVVDVVDICLPTPHHKDITLLAAKAGKHVVCEKPMALSLEDANAMLTACKKAGVRLFIAHVVRFFDHYKAAAAALARGELGKLGTLRLKRAAYQPAKEHDNWFLDESRSGGVALDLMVHDFDVANWFGGLVGAGRITRVFARSSRATDPSAKGDVVLCTLRYEHGAIAHLEGAWAYPPGVFRTGFDVAGTDGVLEWRSDDSGSVQGFLPAQTTSIAAVGLPVVSGGQDPYQSQIKHVLHAIKTGTEFAVTAEDALAALRLGLAARESLKTGQVIHLAWS
jgi:myo-inositol 2-dehydrogenase / D-chiro-inositol 1-dehydrogenase